MALLAETTYRFDVQKTSNWTTNQEKSISTEYPFVINSEPLDQYVARTYLQFLWLPESIMPLQLLVPSLRRINLPSTSSDATVHPMHAFLEPLLLTTRSTSKKYHVELPQILANGGGAGEMEETMMWYALTHEKGDETMDTTTEHDDGPWMDAAWRQKYMDRMERREAQVQILLYLFKLSLHGPLPTKEPKKSRRSRDAEPVLSVEDQLEAFMDKLATWQLLGSLDRSASNAVDRHWTQIFAEDLVEREFKSVLPELCALLRSKVWPSSPFSDDDDDMPVSPLLPNPPMKLAPSESFSKIPSPTLSSSSRATTTSRATSGYNSSRTLSRSRSRSLSISLAQEQEERERVNSMASKKRVLNREISMSRVFKPKPKPKQADAKSIKTEAPTPAPRCTAPDLGVMLVEETPVKPRNVAVAPTKSMSFGQPNFTLASASAPLVKQTSGSLPVLSTGQDEDAEEEWMMDSSPNITFLNPTKDSDNKSTGKRNMGVDLNESEGSDDELTLLATPSKPAAKKRRR